MRGKSLYLSLIIVMSVGILFALFRLVFHKGPDAPISLERPVSERPSNHRLSQSVEHKDKGVWSEKLSPSDRAGGELKGKAEIRTNLELLSYLLDHNQEAEFLTKVDQLIAAYPDVAEYVAIKADFYYMKQNWTAAEESIKRLLELDPENLFAQSSLGEVQGILGKYDEGMQTLNRVIDRDPGNLEALYGTISISDLQGQSEQGLKRVLDLAKANPQNGNLAIVQADILLSQGRYEERYDVLKRAMEADPKNPHPFRIAANDALREGDFAMAGKLAEQALEKDQDTNTRAKSYDIAFRSAMSVRDFDRAESVLARKKQETPWDESIEMALETVKQERAGTKAPSEAN